MKNQLPLLNKEELNSLLIPFVSKLHKLLGNHLNDVILYGSYARNEAEEGSDIDLMILIDLTEEEILHIRNKIYEYASEIFSEKSILISTIIHNKSLFNQRTSFVPFFRNVLQEGINLNVA